jgi:hypothetical protein
MLRRHKTLPLAAVTAAAVLAAIVGVPGTAALFTSEYPVTADVAAGEVFPGDRETAPFSVIDRSSGSAVDASSPYAFAGDGLSADSSAWSSGFAANRYIDFDFNGPLPTGVGVASASFVFRFASATSGSTACFYFELRRASTDAVIEAHGDPGSPVACVTGTAVATTTVALTSLATTTMADDLRVRVYGRDSANGGTTIDAATIGGDYGLATFTLYAVQVRDVADTTPGITRWGLAGS